ncbi:phosphonate ABC transporter permease [bacterium]|nr:phosphonate ABC transporter permease [bacterium]
MSGAGARTRALIGIALAGILAAVALGLDPRELLVPRTLSVLRTFGTAALHPTFVSGAGHPLLPTVLESAKATVAFAVAGTSLAMVVGAFLAFLASSAWWDDEGTGPIRRIGPAVTAVTRVVIAAMRSVHELLWAMLLLAAMGRSPATAVIAIAIPYGGTFAKVWSEMIDEAPRSGAAALRGAGGTAGQVWLLALLPRAAADMASYAFYRFECALRSSAVLGFLGFPTLGYHLSLSFENLLYRETWTFLYALIALVLVVELWSAALRRREGWA